MSAASAGIGIKANFGGARTCTSSARTGSLHAALAGCIKRFFVPVPWKQISRLFGLQERAAKHRLAADRRYTAEEIAVLLQSEYGREILATLMGEARPRWYAGVLAQMAVADARVLERRARRKLEEALDASRDTAAAIERVDAAVSFHHEDVDRHADARRGPEPGVRDRAVARQDQGQIGRGPGNVRVVSRR